MGGLALGAPGIVGKAKPNALKPGTPEHSRFLKEITEWELHAKSILESPWEDMLRWWRLYLADIEDTREEGEEWRAAVHVPYAYSGIETRVASLVDIANSLDPPIQCGPVGGDDIEVARGAEALMRATLDMNNWRYKLDGIIRERCIQGTSLFRLAWRTEVANITIAPTADEIGAYQHSMATCVYRAQQLGLGPPPSPDEMEDFMAWLEEAQQATGVVMPANPFEQTVPTRVWSGPKVERLSLFDCRYDPTVETIHDQPIFLIRSLWTADMLRKNSGPGLDKMFDPAAVEEGIKSRGQGENKLSEQDQEIASVIKIGKRAGAVGTNPLYVNAHEVWEVYRPGNEEFPYTVWLNPKAGGETGKAINKRQHVMPYSHGEIPVIATKNTPVPGYFHGISEIQQPERLYIEMNTHRNLLLDAITLQTMPVLAKVNSFGLPISQFQIRPGAVWDLPRADAIGAVTKALPLADSWNLFQSLKADIDETNSTPSQLRGGAATVGRVSATESERRFSQALARIKQDAVRMEEELTPLAKQGLMLWYQFTTFQQREAMGINPMIANDEILRSLDLDMRFRGATRSEQRDMLVQQMMTFANTFGALLPPHRSMQFARRIYEAMGLKNVDEVIPPQDIALAQRKFEVMQAAPPPPPEGGEQGGGPPPSGGGPPPLADQGAPPAPRPEDVEGAPGGAVPSGGAMV